MKKAQHLEIASDIKKHSIFSNSKGTSYQKVLDNILDKMVATGGRKHDAEAARKDTEGIAKLVNTQSPNKFILSLTQDPRQRNILNLGQDDLCHT